MVSILAGAVNAGPIFGGLLQVGAAYADGFLANKFLTEEQRDPDGDKFLNVPAGYQGAGAPTQLALGRRIRTPAHVIYSSRKSRPIQPDTKGGSGITQRQVFVDAFVALNTAQTTRVVQFFGNGRLLLWTEINLIGVTTPNLTLDLTSGSHTMVVTMNTTNEVDFTSVFKVGDFVDFSNVLFASNADIVRVEDQKIWKVTALTPHGAGPSTMTVDRINDAATFPTTTTGIGGSASQPTRIRRRDDVWDLWELSENVTVPITQVLGHPAGLGQDIQVRSGSNRLDTLFDMHQLNREVRFEGLNPNNPNTYRVSGTDNIGGAQVFRCDTTPGGQTAWSFSFLGPGNGGNTADCGTQYNRALITAAPGTRVDGSDFFPSDYIYEDEFYDGNEAQTTNPILTAEIGATAPTYRGVAYLGLREFNVTQTGNNVPSAMEAILEQDTAATVQSVVRAVLRRAGLKALDLDLCEINDEPFEGMTIRGVDVAARTLEPITMVHQLLHQERKGVLAVFTKSNAEVVDLVNSTTGGYSDIGWDAGGQAPYSLLDPMEMATPAPQKLPTTVRVRFQNPDLAYTESEETHSLRGPRGVGHQLTKELRFPHMAMRRQTAKDFVARELRLAWINSNTFTTSLGMRHLHLLENDFIRVPDENGRLIVARIMSKELVPETLIVELTCMRDDLETDFINYSPVDPSTNTGIPQLPAVTPVIPIILDAPAGIDNQVTFPGLYISGSSGSTTGVWGTAQIWESLDGTNWTFIGVAPTEHPIGTVTNAPTAVPAGNMGELEGVSGAFTYNGGTQIEVEFDVDPNLVALPTASVVDGAENWFWLVHPDGEIEVLGCETPVVDPSNPFKFTLTDCYRGLKGTQAVAQIAAPTGSKLYRADAAYFFRDLSTLGATPTVNEDGTPVLGTTLHYKLLSPGQQLDDVQAVTVNPYFRNARPLPPWSYTETIEANDDITIETNHRSRITFPIGINVQHLFEPNEAYEFALIGRVSGVPEVTKILTAQGSGSSTLRDKFVTFTVADLTAAGHTPANGYTLGTTLIGFIEVRQVGLYAKSRSMIYGD